MTKVAQSIEGPADEHHAVATDHRVTPPRRRSTFSPAAYRDLHNVSPSPEAPRRARTFGTGMTNDNLAEEFAELRVQPAAADPNKPADCAAGLRVDNPADSSNEPAGSTDSGVEDEEADSEEDDEYPMRDETLPNSPVYDKTLQGILREAKTSLQTLETTIRSCPLSQDNETALASLADQTERLAKFEFPKTRIVGFVGDSGAGKSSLINSLLNENLAKSSGDGSACTNIVTEYRYLALSSEGSYNMEVEYMTSEDVTDLLEELLSDYRAYYSDSFKEVRNPEEQKAVKSRAEKASSMLDALFGDRISLEMLSNPASELSTTPLAMLQSLALDILRRRPGGTDTQIWSTTAQSVEELTDQIDPFIRDSSERGLPVIWPFVKIIRIYLRSYVLRTGLVLADLPGLKDLNYARVRATERYMRNCQEVFAVTTIYRATSDAAIKDVISRCGNHRPLRIVCTRSEDVNPREAARSGNAKDSELTRNMVADVEKVKSNLRTKRKSRRKGTSSAKSDKKELSLQDQLAEAEFKLKKFLVERRNNNVIRQLEQLYSQSVQDNDLRVWCVSNIDYDKFKEENSPLNRDQISLSGITGLRSYCQLIPAKAQFKAVTAFLEHQIPALLGSLRQWIQQGSDTLAAQNTEAFNRALTGCAESFEQWREIPRALRSDLKGEFRSSVQHTIEEEKREWRQKGIETCQEWQGLYHSSYAAFCRNYGHHTTNAVGNRNWNAELLQPTHESMSVAWQQYEEAVENRFDAMLMGICSMFDSEKSKLTESNKLAPNTIGSLVSNLPLHHDCIKDLVADARDEMIEKCGNIESNAVGAHSSSYIVSQMIPAYKACNRECGTGSHDRRKTHMKQHISSVNFFPGLGRIIRKAMFEATDAVMQSLEARMRMEFESIVRDVRGCILSKGEPSEPQRFPGTAQAVGKKVEELDDLVERSCRTINRLRD